MFLNNINCIYVILIELILFFGSLLLLFYPLFSNKKFYIIDRNLFFIFIINILLFKLFINKKNKYNSFFYKKLSLLKNNGYSLSYLYKICLFTGRTRSIYNLFRISRINLKLESSFGLFLGLKKSSW